MNNMCVLEDTAGDDQFLKGCNDLFAKHHNENDKTQAIATDIEKRYIFDDSDVLLYPTLVKKIVKRYWPASDIGKGAALLNSARGLSPFVTVYLTE